MQGDHDMSTTTIKATARRLLLGAAALLGSSAFAADGNVTLSPGVLELLRAEMREITAGVQAVPAAIATGDWQVIQDTGAKIRASFIMEKSLTAEQAAELGRALPVQFKALDTAFHDRAARLSAAASARDAELAAYHYARLLEGCARCHTLFARSRFPGLAPQIAAPPAAAPAAPEHRH